MSTSIKTRAGSGADVAVYLDRDVTGWTLTAEYASTSQFNTIKASKPLTAEGRKVILSLSAGEVATLRDAYFRVKAVKDGVTRYVQRGAIDFVESDVKSAFVAGRVLNNDGSVNTQKKLTVVLTADGFDIEDLIIEDVA